MTSFNDLYDLDLTSLYLYLTLLQLRSPLLRGDPAPGRALLPAVSPPGLHGARLGGRHPHNLIFKRFQSYVVMLLTKIH